MKHMKATSRILVQIVTLLLLILGTAESTPLIIDVYGTDEITAEIIEQELGDKLREYSVIHRDPEQFRKAIKLREECVSAIHNMGDFAYVGLSLITYYGTNSGQYLTVDVVEKGQKESRMTFKPEPTGSFSDPDRILAAMDGYVETGFELMRQGKIDGTEGDDNSDFAFQILKEISGQNFDKDDIEAWGNWVSTLQND